MSDFENTKEQAERINKYWKDRGHDAGAYAESIILGEHGRYSVIMSKFKMVVPKIKGNGKPQYYGCGNINELPMKKCFDK